MSIHTTNAPRSITELIMTNAPSPAPSVEPVGDVVLTGYGVTALPDVAVRWRFGPNKPKAGDTIFTAAQLEAAKQQNAEELERLRKDAERYASLLLKIRKAACGDIHNQDNIIEMIEALRKDAERYRWLRDDDDVLACLGMTEETALDEYLDAAIKEAGK